MADTQAYEKAFRDAISQFLDAARTPDPHIEPLLAHALLEFFCSWPLEFFVVRVQPSGGQVRGARADQGASGMLGEGEVGELLTELESEDARQIRQRRSLLRGGNGAERLGRALVIWHCPPVEEKCLEEIWIVLGKNGFLDEELADWFCQHVPVRRNLIQLLSTLRSRRVIPELAYQARDIEGAVDSRLLDRFERAADVLIAILRERAFTGNHPDYMRIAENLGIWMVQALMGMAKKPAGGQLRAHALQAAQALREVQSEHSEAVADTLTALVAPREHTKILDFSDKAPTAWGFLAAWTWMHELTRAVALDREEWAEADSEAWERLAGETARWLAQRMVEGTWSMAPHPHTQSGLQLWFCQKILASIQHGFDRRTTRAARRQLRADLSFMLREVLRTRLLGHRADHQPQPAAAAAALRTLVEYHARYEIGLPAELDIAGHLLEIGESPHRVFSAGHLQHVLNVYLAGHFLCSLGIGSPTNELAAILASRASLGTSPGPQTVADFRTAFSMAVLFHDTGMLLFPDLSPPNERIGREDRELSAALHSVSSQLSLAGRELVGRCVTELKVAGWIDLRADPILTRWIEDQEASGEPDHALLGAWYLHSLCRQLPNPSPEIIRDAVRAILLHGAPARPILVAGDGIGEGDPVAALLVLGDELFEWLPSTDHEPEPSGRSRAQHIEILDLKSSYGEDHSTIYHWIPPQPTWPRIAMTLHANEFQHLPPFQTFLTMAQNIGRIHPTQSGFSPEILVYTELPENNARIRDTLERLTRSPLAREIPFAAHLELWLGDAERFPPTDADTPLKGQALRIFSEGRSLHIRDIRPFLPTMRELVSRIIQQWEHRGHR